MDKTNLINYYKRPCFIFNGCPISIEDDEILDLDSISLDSNEDTWLLSNSKGSSFKEFDEEEMKNCMDNLSLDGSSDFSRITLTNWDFKEETIDDSSFLNIKNTPCKKLEFNTVENKSPANHELGNIRKQDTFSNERDTFKKPLTKKDISEKNSILYSIENKLFGMGNSEVNDYRSMQNHEIKNIEHDGSRKLVDDVIGQEKNFVELNGTEKRKSLINEPIPIGQSTPMPMLFKRRVSKIETEKKSWQKSTGQLDGSGDSPIVNSSTFGKKEPDCVVDSSSELAKTVAKVSVGKDDLNLNSTYDKDINLNSTYEIDNASTSSSDSRRSSNSGNYLPKATSISQNRTFSRPSSTNHGLDSGRNGNIRSPSRTSSARKAPSTFSDIKMKQSSRRTPSLSRLAAPSLNMDEEFVSVVEIKSKDAACKMIDKKPTNGPLSHIPRPSTRIPVFRTSNSCTRTSFKK